MAIQLSMRRIPEGSLPGLTGDGYEALILSDLDNPDDPEFPVLRLYSEWDCLWFLLDAHDRITLRNWTTSTTTSVLSGAVIGRRLLPERYGRAESEPLDALRWNTHDDVRQIAQALAHLDTLVLPPPGAASRAQVYHARHCPDSEASPELVAHKEADLERLQAFYAAAAREGQETLHSLD